MSLNQTDKLITLPSGRAYYDNDSVESRFLQKVLKDIDSGCWLWDGATTRSGYGHFRIKTTEGWSMLRAHIYAHWRYNDGVGTGTQVMHSCDNPRCCNPEHLSLGTAKENSKDAQDKGRSARGSKNAPIKHKLHGRLLMKIKLKRFGGFMVKGTINRGYQK